ncbi:hypothetical protein Tco_0152239 [Tanacetum coccineum]
MEDRRDKVQAEYHVDKEVNMIARDSDDALVCCVENTVEDRIMDYGASFHATYTKKSYKGSSYALVRYIPGLKRRLILVGQLAEEGYHVGFRDQQWKVTKGSLEVGRGNKHGSLWFGEAEESFLHNVSEDKETAETAAGFAVGLRILEDEWRGKDTSLVHLKVFGCDSFVKVKDVCGQAIKCTFIGSGSDEMRYSFWDMKSHQKSQVVLVDILENLAENDSMVAEHGLSLKITQSPGGSSYMSEGSENNGSFEDSGRLDEEYSENGASCKEGGSKTPHNQTCSLVKISAGKKASQRLWMFKVKEEQNSSEKEPSYMGALNDTSAQHKSKGFQLARQKENLECRLKEIMYRLIQAPWLWYLKFDSSDMEEFNKPKWQVSLVFKMKDRCSEKQVLGYLLIDGVTTVEWESRLQKSITIDVHQVGDEREVEVLHNLNWPLSELITEDGVLPERGYSQFNDVSSGYLDTLFRKSPSPAFGWCSLSWKLATENVEKLFTRVKPFTPKKEKVEKYSHPTEETDVDSFGIILFKLLSEKLAIDKYSHPALALMTAHYFKEKRLHLLILGDIMKQTDAKSIDILSEIAYECLQKDQEKRSKKRRPTHESTCGSTRLGGQPIASLAIMQVKFGQHPGAFGPSKSRPRAQVVRKCEGALARSSAKENGKQLLTIVSRAHIESTNLMRLGSLGNSNDATPIICFLLQEQKKLRAVRL